MFEQLIEQHKRIVYQICRAYCPNPGLRDDLAQEILIQLWRAFPKFDNRCKFSTWMYRIALNVAISFYRRETRHRTEPIEDVHISPEPLNDLHHFIDQLDPLDRALILLYLEDHSYQEIAGIVGITETNTATKINRIKTRLKQSWNSKP